MNEIITINYKDILMDIHFHFVNLTMIPETVVTISILFYGCKNGRKIPFSICFIIPARVVTILLRSLRAILL